MKKRFNINNILVLLFITVLIYACANKGSGPQGGARDTTPPKVVKSTPINGALNFKKKEIQIEFDENISLEKLMDNVVISPPQKKNPDIKAYGKRLRIKFDEDLKDSTTYTISFGNAIVDLNEKTPLANYRFSFSTEDKIDSLSISGTLIDSENLNPLQGIIVGIYEETDDSVFHQKPFMRIGKTDANGHFSIDNIRHGTYKLFGLGDNNRNFTFQAGEGLAMYDELITPTFEMAIHQDTIMKDSIHVDTILSNVHTHFEPDDILLRFFKEDKKRQYFIKSERLQPEKFTLYFNAAQKELPKLEALNFQWKDKYIIQQNNTLDTLTYWVKDTLISQLDTLMFSMTYLKTDSIFQWESTTDTIKVAQRKTARTNKKDNDLKDTILPFRSNASGTFELNNFIKLQMTEPLSDYDISKITLYQKIDSTLTPLQYNWSVLDSTLMNFSLEYAWKPEMSYELAIDSAAFISIYNKVSNKFTGKFKTRSLDEYSKVTVVVTNYDKRAIIQLMNAKDVIIAEKKAEVSGTKFEYLKPAEYYLRLFIDENENGKWDTGDLKTRRQPEQVYYYPYKLTLKANFEFTEKWDFLATPLLNQKPKELIEATKKK